jgi:DNA-binding Lrp family transcriptional regulator
MPAPGQTRRLEDEQPLLSLSDVRSRRGDFHQLVFPPLDNRIVMDELLKILESNALESRETIAKMLNVSVAEINKRIAEYEKKGIIRAYQAILNEDQLDLDSVTAVIEVKVTPEREGGFNHVAERISRFPEVRSAYLMSGTYDLLLFVQGKNLREVASFVSERLSPLEGVLSTSTHFMLKTYKRLGVLMHTEKSDERLSVSP